MAIRTSMSSDLPVRDVGVAPFLYPFFSQVLTYPIKFDLEHQEILCCANLLRNATEGNLRMQWLWKSSPPVSARIRLVHALGLWASAWMLLHVGSWHLAQMGPAWLTLGTLGVGGLALLLTRSALCPLTTRRFCLTMVLLTGLFLAVAIPLPSPFQPLSTEPHLALPPPGISPDAIRSIQGFGSPPWAGWISDDPLRNFATGVYIAVQAILLGFLITSIVLWLGERTPRHPPRAISRPSWILLYALPCWLIWLIYFLAFYPGIFPADSLNQWQQILSGSFDNRHPAVHTLSMALVYWIGRSPAAVTLTQMFVLGGIIGIAVRALERWGVSTSARGFLVLAAAFSPANSLMSVTMWKDVPYAMGMLGLSAALLHLIRDFIEERRPAPSTWAGIVLGGLAIAFYRHNGLPVVLFTLGLLIVLWKKQATKLITCSVFPIIVCYIMINSIGIYAFKISPVPRWFAFQALIHQVSALIYAETPLTVDEAMFLDRIQPLKLWRDGYTCRFLDPVVNNDQLDRKFFDENAWDFMNLWLRLIRRNPTGWLRHYLCSTDFLWRITQPENAYVYAFEWGTPPNALGLSTRPILPELRNGLWRIFRETLRPEWIWLFWRPAVFFYLIILIGIVLARRHGARPAIGLIGPAILHTLLWLPILTAPDFRFQYPVYLVALILSPLLLGSAAPGRSTPQGMCA